MLNVNNNNEQKVSTTSDMQDPDVVTLFNTKKGKRESVKVKLDKGHVCVKVVKLPGYHHVTYQLYRMRRLPSKTWGPFHKKS